MQTDLDKHKTFHLFETIKVRFNFVSFIKENVRNFQKLKLHKYLI